MAGDTAWMLIVLMETGKPMQTMIWNFMCIYQCNVDLCACAFQFTCDWNRLLRRKKFLYLIGLDLKHLVKAVKELHPQIRCIYTYYRCVTSKPDAKVLRSAGRTMVRLMLCQYRLPFNNHAIR